MLIGPPKSEAHITPMIIPKRIGLEFSKPFSQDIIPVLIALIGPFNQNIIAPVMNTPNTGNKKIDFNPLNSLSGNGFINFCNKSTTTAAK